MKALEYLLSQPLLCTEAALQSAISIVTRDPEFKPESVDAYRSRQFDGAVAGTQRRDGVAVIPVVGPLFRYASFFTELCGGATVEQLALDFQAALDNPAIEAIVLAIDSPGGESNGIEELASMIRAGTTRKPVVAYVGHIAASGAYWLASAAGEVVMSRAAMVGSIGVVWATQVKEDKPGTKTYQFVSSQSPLKRPDFESDAGRASMQTVVDDLAKVFIAAVAEGRDTTPEKVASDFGGGGMLIAEKAIAVGMADRMGSFEQVISELSAQAAAGQRSSFSVAAASRESDTMFGFRLRPGKDGSVDVQAIEPEGSAQVFAAELKTDSGELVAKEKENAELRKQLLEAKTETIKATAAGWYGALLASNKIVPAEKDAALAAYVQAAFDDTEHPLPEGKKRVAMLEAVYASRTAHTLTQDMVDGGKEAPVLNGANLKTLPVEGKRNHEDEVRAGLEALVNLGRYPADILKG